MPLYFGASSPEGWRDAQYEEYQRRLCEDNEEEYDDDDDYEPSNNQST